MTINKDSINAITSKASYLEFRFNWKQEYETLSKDQRNFKLMLKAAFRNRSSDAWKLQHKIASGKNGANYLIEILKLAKERAQQQYLEEKKELLTTATEL